jgi:hypothetical protein
MKIKEVIRRSSFMAALALLCFVPGSFAQSAQPASITSSVAVFVYGSDGWGDDGWGDKHKKRVDAPEGGSASLYLLLAGLSCCTAMVVRSRRSAGSV